MHPLVEVEYAKFIRFFPDKQLREKFSTILENFTFNSDTQALAVNIQHSDTKFARFNAEKSFLFTDSTQYDREKFVQLLHFLKPWRKGRFQFDDIKIEGEWDCFLKWQRFCDHIDLSDKSVLDIGAGNGYYALQMLRDKPRFLLALEPSQRFFLQYKLLESCLQSSRPELAAKLAMLPLTFEQFVESQSYGFDYVFLLGVLYHRRSPIEHLLQVRSVLNDNGTLIIETLYEESEHCSAIIPRDRYAKMKNIWFIPSIKMLHDWLIRCKFRDIEVIDCSTTTDSEQRVTCWSSQQSLADFLDPTDTTRTVEGYQRPKRVIVKAIR